MSLLEIFVPDSFHIEVRPLGERTRPEPAGKSTGRLTTHELVEGESNDQAGGALIGDERELGMLSDLKILGASVEDREGTHRERRIDRVQAGSNGGNQIPSCVASAEVPYGALTGAFELGAPIALALVGLEVPPMWHTLVDVTMCLS